jgi:hypothetical protein
MSISKMLTYQGRLILVNSVLSALPTFYMCPLKIPINIFDQATKSTCYGIEVMLLKKVVV